MIQRFTDFSVISFFKELVLSCGNAKTSFLKAECCRFLGEVLKRHKSLNVESLGVINGCLSLIVSTLGDALKVNFSKDNNPLIVENVNTDIIENDNTKSNKKKKSKKNDVPEVDVKTENGKTEIGSSASGSGNYFIYICIYIWR